MGGSTVLVSSPGREGAVRLETRSHPSLPEEETSSESGPVQGCGKTGGVLRRYGQR